MVLNQNEYTMVSLGFNYQKSPLFLPNQTLPYLPLHNPIRRPSPLIFIIFFLFFTSSHPSYLSDSSLSHPQMHKPIYFPPLFSLIAHFITLIFLCGSTFVCLIVEVVEFGWFMFDT